MDRHFVEQVHAVQARIPAGADHQPAAEGHPVAVLVSVGSNVEVGAVVGAGEFVEQQPRPSRSMHPKMTEALASSLVPACDRNVSWTMVMSASGSMSRIMPLGDGNLWCLRGDIGRPHANEPVTARLRRVVGVDEAELAQRRGTRAAARCGSRCRRSPAMATWVSAIFCWPAWPNSSSWRSKRSRSIFRHLCL